MFLHIFTNYSNIFPHATNLILLGLQLLIFLLKGNVPQVRHLRSFLFPINRAIFLQEWITKFFFPSQIFSTRSLYNKGSFIDFYHEQYIASPFDRFLQDLDISFCGKHIPHLLRRVRDSQTVMYYLDTEPRLLGILKDNLQSNHSSAYNCASWE